MKRPKVIFFDAVGTLFGVRGSVGEVYAEVARREAQVETEAAAVETAFFESFKAAPPAEFPETAPEDLLEREQQWWYEVVRNTFETVGVFDRFGDFDRFFDRLFSYFASAEPWFLYPDVLPTLQYWKQQGVELGIVSNFDSRLYAVLEALELSPFFSSVTISTRVGAAKPNPLIFDRAVAAHDCSPEAAWHVGDSYRDDCEGARGAGLRGIWLDRG
ncbi:HAD-IA family hydrolase [Baaleninema sp.]|uniref:HAD-IA family hydrolase n=1 Tax=Baaleninema sp. TaxID=3101197 RepID=UPI003D05A6CD